MGGLRPPITALKGFQRPAAAETLLKILKRTLTKLRYPQLQLKICLQFDEIF